MNYLEKERIWVYEREDGDGGIVIANTEDEALNELRKVYGNDDINERIDPDRKKYKYTWGLSILTLDYYYSEGNVFITHPY